MRVRAETLLIAAMGLFAVTGLAAVYFLEAENALDPALVDPLPAGTIEPGLIPSNVDPVTVQPNASQTAREWFEEMRRFCNPVDVVTRLRWQPAPDTDAGRKHEAACYALAGRTDLARASIERLPESQRHHAAGVVFEAGHPAADAGDELAAGPLMELVVEYWPNHYMALYHAGAAAYQRGEYDAAEGYLERFLEEYSVDDGWRSSATSMLEQIGG